MYFALFIAAFFLAVLLLNGCVPRDGTSPRSVAAIAALSAFSSVIEPAYKLTAESCNERERDARAALADGAKAMEVQARLAGSRARCEALGQAFEAIRDVHHAASDYVESGQLAEAEDALEQLRVRWAALPEGAP
jgi:hypothetical protein